MGAWEEALQEGDICVCIADSLCCTAETNITLTVKQLYSNNKVLKKRENFLL